MEDLARLSFKRTPLYVGIDDQGPTSTREGLEQGYCVVPSAQRFLLLFTFLKKNLNKKVRMAPAAVVIAVHIAEERLLLVGVHEAVFPVHVTASSDDGCSCYCNL